MNTSFYTSTYFARIFDVCFLASDAINQDGRGAEREFALKICYIPIIVLRPGSDECRIRLFELYKLFDQRLMQQCVSTPDHGPDPATLSGPYLRYGNRIGLPNKAVR